MTPVELAACAPVYLVVGVGVSVAAAVVGGELDDSDTLTLGMIALAWPVFAAVGGCIIVCAGVGKAAGFLLRHFRGARK